MSFLTLQFPVIVLFLIYLTYYPLPSIVDSGFSFIVWKPLFSSFLDRFSAFWRSFLRCMQNFHSVNSCIHTETWFCFQFCIPLLPFLISFEIPVAFQMPLSNDLRFSEKQKLPWGVSALEAVNAFSCNSGPSVYTCKK